MKREREREIERARGREREQQINKKARISERAEMMKAKLFSLMGGDEECVSLAGHRNADVSDVINKRRGDQGGTHDLFLPLMSSRTHAGL